MPGISSRAKARGTSWGWTPVTVCAPSPSILTADGATGNVPLLKLLWDAMGSEFGGRHELYESNYAGNYENIRIETMLTAQATGEMEMMQQLVEDYMAEYGLDGWTVPDMINPWDVNRLKGGFQ